MTMDDQTFDVQERTPPRRGRRRRLLAGLPRWLQRLIWLCAGVMALAFTYGFVGWCAGADFSPLQFLTLFIPGL